MSLSTEPGSGRLLVRLPNLLRDGGLRRALESGLPLRIRLVVQLWKDGLFDDLEEQAEWRATLVHEPLEGRYTLETGGLDSVRTSAGTPEAAGELLARTLAVPATPDGPGRFYWLAVLEVETLSLSDLEELGRWLRGDVAPVVAGEREVESAVARGVRRLVVRVLGLPARRYRVRTPTFEVERGSSR